MEKENNIPSSFIIPKKTNLFMYAVVNHLQYTKPADDFKGNIQNKAAPLFSKCPGFIDYHVVKVD
jgi:hypothetical protein